VTPSELRWFWLAARHQPAVPGHIARDLAAWPDAECVTFSTETEPETNENPTSSEPEASEK
jgi:hypothetical protein